MPRKVDIPDRYLPDSEEEELTEAEQQYRQEKAHKIRNMLAAHRYTYITLWHLIYVKHEIEVYYAIILICHTNFCECFLCYYKIFSLMCFKVHIAVNF